MIKSILTVDIKVSEFDEFKRLADVSADMYRALRGVSDKLPFTPNQFGGGYSITLTQAEVDAIRAALAKADG